MVLDTVSSEEIKDRLTELPLSDIMRCYRILVKRGDHDTARLIKRQRAAGELLADSPLQAHALDDFMARVDAEQVK